VTAGVPSPIPIAPPQPPPRPVRVAERLLPNGLRVMALRKPGVPLATLRLQLPFAGRDPAHRARAELLSETMLMGTATRGATELASAIQRLGGSLGVDADADHLGLSGSVLSANLGPFMALLAEVLTTAAYREAEVEGERERLVQKLVIARSQPGVVAREALLRRLHPGHPYGHELPAAEDVLATSPSDLRSLHRRRVGPAGAVLVVVGDVQPASALRLLEGVLAGWASTGGPVRLPRVPSTEPGPVLLVDRPGAAQTNIRMAAPGLPRSDPDHAALDLANVMFGGYFSSRLVANIRERNGYSYSPRSTLEHPRAAPRLVVSADVGTEVTAPALVETWYELGRMAAGTVSEGELDSARRYAAGLLALGSSSQAGLASLIARLAMDGIGPDYLRSYPRALSRVTVEQVHRVARAHLGPARAATVLVGDAGRIGDGVGALAEVDVQRERRRRPARGRGHR
jgi:zinc protease